MDSKVIKPHQNLILNSNHLLLFRQRQIFRSTRHKNLQKQINEDFLYSLLNPCLHFTNNKFTILTHIEEILEQPIILNPHSTLNKISALIIHIFTESHQKKLQISLP